MLPALREGKFILFIVKKNKMFSRLGALAEKFLNGKNAPYTILYGIPIYIGSALL